MATSKDTNRHLEFSKSIIPGVEIKQCRNTPHAYKAHLHNELSMGIIIEGETDPKSITLVKMEK